MSDLRDDDDRLAGLLRAIPTPEPPPEFLAGAHRRYLAAIDARFRREVFTGLLTAILGLALLAAILAPSVEPATPIAWLAEAAADATRWMTGVAIVLSLVPMAFWASATLGFTASMLSLALLARARSSVVMK